MIKAIKKKKLADEVAALNCNVIISKGKHSVSFDTTYLYNNQDT